MKVCIMLPFVVLRVDVERAECLSTLTDDYAKQFNDVKYVYPTGSELMGRKAHYTGCTSWIYTKILPQTFRLYEEEAST